jgi:AcrR family transcriptional regulator
VAAASELLDEAGPEALTVRAIAHRAGCSTMVVYSHFGGKDGVVEALYVQGFERLGAVLRGIRHTGDPVADLQRLGRAYRRFALDHPTSYRVMFTRAVPDFEASPAAAALASATLDVLAERVARAVDAGSLGPGEPRQLAACLWAAIHGAVSLELQDAGPPDIDWPACHERMLAALSTGIG